MSLMRLLRLWRVYAWLDLIWVTRGLQEWVTWCVHDVIVTLGTVSAMFLLAERFHGIGGWSRNQVLFMLAYAVVVTGALALGFNFNILMISRRVGRGQLDHLLIQPHPIAVALFTEGFTPFSSSGTLFIGTLFLAWTVRELQLRVTAVWSAELVLNLLSSGAIVLAFAFVWGSVAFLAPRAAEEINTSSNRLLFDLKSFPLQGLSPALQGCLLTVIPVGFFAWYPSRVLLGLDRVAWHVIVTPLAAVVFGSLAAAVFSAGLRYYGRTGSQRYHSMGHRR